MDSGIVILSAPDGVSVSNTVATAASSRDMYIIPSTGAPDIIKNTAVDINQTVKKLIHCEREGSGVEGTPEFIPQAEFISAEENPVFLRPDKVQGFSQK